MQAHFSHRSVTDAIAILSGFKKKLCRELQEIKTEPNLTAEPAETAEKNKEDSKRGDSVP
jgi:hypothetical protein